MVYVRNIWYKRKVYNSAYNNVVVYQDNNKNNNRSNLPVDEF